MRLHVGKALGLCNGSSGSWELAVSVLHVVDRRVAGDDVDGRGMAWPEDLGWSSPD